MRLSLLQVEDDHTQFNFDRLAEFLSVGPRAVSGGALNIATSESTTSTSYTTLTTPDTVTVVLPTDGLIAVWYQALWQNTLASNGRAAIFLNSNQLKVAPSGGAGTVPVVQETNGNSSANIDTPITTAPQGIAGSNNSSNVTEVTTGQIVASVAGVQNAGPTYIFADAGTYDVSVKFKNNAAGTLTVKKRHLWAAAYSFA